MIYFRYLFFGLLISTFSLPVISQNTEPKPIMGNKILKEFIKIHIDYPEKDFQQKVQGTVTINFTVDNKGNILNYKVVNSVSNSLDSACISIFKLILWNPATSLGKPVAGESEFAIKYNIKNFNKTSKKRGYKHITPPYIPIDNSGKIYSLNQLDTLPKAILPTDVSSFSEFIYTNLVYPDAAAKLALSGKVELSFIIETNGLPSNIIPLKYLGGGCTEEAIRITESIIWKPGILNQEAVRSKFILSINFQKDENQDRHIPNQQGSGI